MNFVAMATTVIAAGALAGGAVAQPSAANGSISVGSAAWSTAPARWTIHPDGSIDDTHGATSFAVGVPIHMVALHTPAAPGRFLAIERLLAPARALAGRPIRCDVQHSDDIFGDITWPDGTRLTYAFGCEGAANQPVIDGVRAASRQIDAWVAGAPIVRSYDLTEPSQQYDPPPQ